MDEEKLASAAEGLQSAFLGELAFGQALHGIAQVVGARGAALIPVSGGLNECLFSPNIEEMGHAYMTTHWSRNDFRMAAVGKMLRTGVAVDQDIVTPDVMERMPYYAEFLEPLGGWWFAGIPVSAGEHIFALTVQRTRTEGPVVETEQEALRRLGYGLSQSATVAARIAAARVKGVFDGLEAMGDPAILVDSDSCVLQVNAAAAAYEADLHMRIGRPLVALSAANGQLRSHLRAAVGRRVRPDDPCFRPVVVRRDGRRPLVLRVRRLTGGAATIFSCARALVLIDDLNQVTCPPAKLLCDLFGLTTAQAKVAALIGSGASLKECAEELRITNQTARTYLKQAFQTVGVSRQGELVSVLSRLRATNEPRR